MADPNNLLTPENVCFNFICKAGNTTFKRMVVQKHVRQEDWTTAYSAPHAFFKYVNKNYPADLVIGFCRNPIDRLISCWKDKIKRHYHSGFARRNYPLSQSTSLYEFIDFVCETPDELSEQHFRSQTWDHFKNIDYMIRLEHMEEDWNVARRAIINKVGVDYGPLQHHNKSSVSPPKISGEYTRKIFKRFEKDFEELGYEY
jgi:hypothetical protein